MSDIYAIFEDNEELARLFKKDDVIEIINRRKNGRIKQIIRGKLINDGSNGNSSKSLANKAISLLEKGNLKVGNANKALNEMSKGIDGLNGNVQNIDNSLKKLNTNIQNTVKDIKGIANLECLNVGLAIANIAVDIVGFAILSKQLNELESTVISISNNLDKKLDQLNNIKKGEIKEEYETINMKFLYLSRKIQDQDKYDNEDIIDLINILKPYISKLLNFYYTNAIEREDILTMLSVLSATYSKLINLYMTNYYFEKGKILPDLQMYESIFNQFVSDEFRQYTFDYFFLEKRMNDLDARNAANAYISCILQDVIAISDQISVLSTVHTKENYEAMESILSTQAEKQADELLVKAQS